MKVTKASMLILLFMLLLILLAVTLPSREVSAEFGPGYQSGDALWHLPKFGEQGWFIHASQGRVRVCNMDKTSVVGDRPAPRCSHWN